jgi:membrane protease YdiL (CAAX protease family)
MPWDVCVILFVLAVVVPWRGSIRLRQLLSKPRLESRQRISLYLSTIAFQWIAAGVAAWRSWAHGYSASELGMGTGRGALVVVISTITGTAILATLHWLNFRRMSGLLERVPRIRAMAERILPQSRVELIPFLGLALTAGICEEFLYRGFAMAAFGRTGFPIWASVVVSSILFGVAHLYQGRGGAIGTGLLGLLFGTFRSILGSLVPVAAWHAAVDVVAGIAGPRYLIHNTPVTRDTTNP